MRAALALVVLALVAISTASGAAGPLVAGDVVPSLALTDQHGVERTLDASLHLVLLSRDMDGGGVVRELLAQDGSAWLNRHSAVYVADVSRMPSLVRRAIALPRMRRRPYPVLLDTSGEPTASLPSASGQATLIRLDAMRIVSVKHFHDAAALRQAAEAGVP